MEPDILQTAAGWIEAGHKVAVATVLTAWGSAPRRPGAQMAVRGDGVIAGSVSAGCVENAVVHEAMECLAGGGARRRDFGVDDGQAMSVGLSCGGVIGVWIEDGGFAPGALARIAGGQPFARLIRLETGQSQFAAPGEVPAGLAAGQAGLVATADGRVFVDPFQPAPRLLVVGATHIAQALAPMAAVLGWRMTVIDPRTAFASAERFPGVDLHSGWPDEALAELRPDANTAIVALTHDAKLDDPALIAALPSDAFYVGALGSRKSQAARRARLLAAGVPAWAVARLHGPVGLAIGAANPAEIAVSVLAEIIQARRCAARAAMPAIILAAGQARRMGGGKMMRPFAGKPLARHAVEAALAAGAEPVLLVTGQEGPDIAAIMSDLPVTLIANERPQDGMGHSIALAARRLPVNARAAFVVLGDMPLVKAAHLQALRTAFDAADPSCICVPVSGGRRGHPVLFGAAHFSALADLTGEAGARGLLETQAAHVREIPLDDAVLVDVDTSEALEAAAARLARSV